MSKIITVLLTFIMANALLAKTIQPNPTNEVKVTQVTIENCKLSFNYFVPKKYEGKLVVLVVYGIGYNNTPIESFNSKNVGLNSNCGVMVYSDDKPIRFVIYVGTNEKLTVKYDATFNLQ